MAGTHSKTTADQLRDLLEARVYSERKLHTLHKLFSLLKNGKRQESVAAFGERLGSESNVSRTPVADGTRLNWLKTEKPSRAQEQTILLRRDLGTVVSTVWRLPSALESCLEREGSGSSETYYKRVCSMIKQRWVPTKNHEVLLLPRDKP